MQNLTIDTGMQEFCVNGRGVLRFNPADPNLYHRFFALGAQLDALDAELTARTPADDAEGLALLTEIFGAHNDFDALLEGVSLAAVGQNGKRVVQNLLEALTPVLQAGAEQHLQAVADAAAAEADAARVQRQSL